MIKGCVDILIWHNHNNWWINVVFNYYVQNVILGLFLHNFIAWIVSEKGNNIIFLDICWRVQFRMIPLLAPTIVCARWNAYLVSRAAASWKITQEGLQQISGPIWRTWFLSPGWRTWTCPSTCRPSRSTTRAV